MPIIDRIREHFGNELAAELEQARSDSEQIIEEARRATELRIAQAQERERADRETAAQLRATARRSDQPSQQRRVPIPGDTAEEKFAYIAKQRGRNGVTARYRQRTKPTAEERAVAEAFRSSTAARQLGLIP